jgi:hypothetical protein
VLTLRERVKRVKNNEKKIQKLAGTANFDWQSHANVTNIYGLNAEGIGSKKTRKNGELLEGYQTRVEKIFYVFGVFL